MPAQKRPHAAQNSDHAGASTATATAASTLAVSETDRHHHDAELVDGEAEVKTTSAQQQQAMDSQTEPQVKKEEQEKNDSDDEGGEDGDGNENGSSSSESEEEEMDDKDPYVIVKLSDIRKEVQCPICLGIIRKTRTVMECLHRFCRECIDKSMRLGNNECPACRTHCASRRSLRDDPNYDALISALYPDIDKYEEEELALHEEDKSRNKKIQAYIAETFRRQSEALGRRKSSTAKATAAAFVRRSQANYRNHGQNNYLRGRGRSGGRDVAITPSDEDDEEEANGNDGSKDSSSAEEPSPDRKQKRCRRWVAPRSSPARAAGNSDAGCEDNDELDINRENNIGTSPLRTGSREMLAWGKNGTRSQTRHGNASGLNARFLKGGRMTKLVEYLHTLNVNDDELDVQLNLAPLDKENTPNLEQPCLCCRPTLSIRQLCEFIARQTSLQAEEIQIYVREHQCGNSTMKSVTSIHLTELKVLEGQESLAAIYASFSRGRQQLELLYHLKGNARDA